MTFASLLGALTLAALSPQNSPAVPQTPPADDPTGAAVLEDVVIDGRRLDERVREFVEEVAAPPRRRGIARWWDRVCFGVVNLQPDQARALVDRLSTVADEYGVRLAEPGCRPNVVVIFADDGRAMADAVVEAERPLFHLGVGGLDRGKAALEVFRQSDAPVRWWHVSLPVIGSTGQRAIRMPGDFGPIYVPAEGLVNHGRPITDVLNKVIVIVDAGKVEGIGGDQLAEYLAMVSLAQVDPEGDIAGYDTVLNLFAASAAPAGLTTWDRSYLESLYRSRPDRIDPSRQARAVTRILRAGEDGAPEAQP
ncbi:hypothetical protein [Brevundimonas sp.]|uniref:hypothetical protein n=1 Tax=Brevundimonas sp. TaxID=1871086 RepID=UPI002D2A6482|nr:hypothetical protein [Brevundimonas sp.]HYD28275.1 hypothetical protein [Brevundimonas sp.]